MLPVYTPKKDAPPDATMPEDMTNAPVDEDPAQDLPTDDEGAESIHKVNQAVVVYKPSSMGPFMCSNCLHYIPDGQCAVVSGEIDPDGLCNIFETATTPPGEGEEGMESEMPMEAPMEGEMPEEPPVEEPTSA